MRYLCECGKELEVLEDHSNEEMDHWKNMVLEACQDCKNDAWDRGNEEGWGEAQSMIDNRDDEIEALHDRIAALEDELAELQLGSQSDDKE